MGIGESNSLKLKKRRPAQKSNLFNFHRIAGCAILSKKKRVLKSVRKRGPSLGWVGQDREAHLRQVDAAHRLVAGLRGRLLHVLQEVVPQAVPAPQVGGLGHLVRRLADAAVQAQDGGLWGRSTRKAGQYREFHKYGLAALGCPAMVHWLHGSRFT